MSLSHLTIGNAILRLLLAYVRYVVIRDGSFPYEQAVARRQLETVLNAIEQEGKAN